MLLLFHFILCIILFLSYNLIDSFVTLPEYSYIFFYLIMLFILKDKLFINSKDQNLLKGNQSENLDLDKIELEKEQDNKLIFNSDENLNDEKSIDVKETNISLCQYKQASVKSYIGVAFLSLIICFIVFASFALLIWWSDIDRFLSLVMGVFEIRHPNFLSFVGSIILAPIVEEILFRKELFTKLKSKLPVVIAILISSFVFGCLHGIVSFLPTFIEGIWVCYIYNHTDDIYLSMLAHAYINSLALFGIIAILFVPFSIIWWYIVRKIFYKVA